MNSCAGDDRGSAVGVLRPPTIPPDQATLEGLLAAASPDQLDRWRSGTDTMRLRVSPETARRLEQAGLCIIERER